MCITTEFTTNFYETDVTSSVLKDLIAKTYIYENSNFTQASNSFWANIGVAQLQIFVQYSYAFGSF